MEIPLSEPEQSHLTEFAKKLQHARASDLEQHTNSLTEDTYRINTGIFNSTFYWPDGHPGPVEDVPYLKQLSPTEQQHIDEFEANNPYTYLAHGVGRVTFTIDTNDNYIVKFGRWGTDYIMGNGIQVNQQEHRFYNYVDDYLPDNPLLPLTQIGDNCNWAIQRRVITYENYDGAKPDFDTILKRINECLGPFAGLITDKTENNVGYVDGNWYLFDYGQRL